MKYVDLNVFKLSGDHALCVFFAIVMLLMPNGLLASEPLTKAGWIEEAYIYPGELVVEAKLDTGAKTSSLHAEDITQFERDGQPWVKFTVKDQNGKSSILEQKIHRIVKIKRHKGKSAKRPVVLMDICLGKILRNTEVNLTDRSRYKFPLLIGRVFLNEYFVVDPSSKRTLKTNCQAKFRK